MNEALTVRDIAKFLIGRADAIQKVASSSSAIWTGIALTILTAFARNYDQTYIPEKPILWFLGPLLFSLISGTWLYFVCYTLCARRHFPADQPYIDDSWPGFMGTFWMTAPIAWLYAIPVERMFDSTGAVYANIILLTVVAIWRVVLMGRVLAVVTGVHFIRTQMWVILAASIEVLVITIFGGTMAKRIGTAMGGMRNSPEEEILINVMLNAGEIALWSFAIAFVGLGVWRWKKTSSTWPKQEPASVPWIPLVIWLAIWSGVAVPNQVQLGRNVDVEKLVASRNWRPALDLMGQYGQDGFAPARPLPPKLFETTLLSESLGLAGHLSDSDPDWIQSHTLIALDRVPEFLHERVWPESDFDTNSMELFEYALRRSWPEARDFLPILSSSNLAQPVQSWRTKNRNLFEAIAWIAAEPPINSYNKDYPMIKQTNDWLMVSNLLANQGYVYPKPEI